MNRTAKFLFFMLAFVLCLINTACANKGAAWEDYALVSPDTDTQLPIVYGIKD